MAGSKEIRNKIKSVQSTRKITKAMEMVAASKMKRAQDRMRASRPYVGRMVAIAQHLAHANPEYRHEFLLKRPAVRNVGLIIVTSDKGLCGGLNTNALRLALSKIKEWQAAGIGVQVTPLGSKGFGFMQRLKAVIASYATNLGDRPSLDSDTRRGSHAGAIVRSTRVPGSLPTASRVWQFQQREDSRAS